MREVFMERSIAARATDSSLGVRGRAGFMLAACAAVSVTLEGHSPEGFTTNWWNARLQYELIKR